MKSSDALICKSVRRSSPRMIGQQSPVTTNGVVFNMSGPSGDLTSIISGDERMFGVIV